MSGLLLTPIFFAVALNQMRITFDPRKNARNIAERGLPFEFVADIEWDTAAIVEDLRRDYGEQRFRVFRRLSSRLHVAVVTRRDDAIHVISLRKANRKEMLWYEQEKG